MKCSIYLPPQADTGQVPVLYWLSGLTCTHENFITKAGAQQFASELGVMLVNRMASHGLLGLLVHLKGSMESPMQTVNS